jgi:serine/threonine protein kinase
LGKFPPKGLNFLKQLLRMKPSDRLTAIEALKHPYFDGVREEDFMKKFSANCTRQESKLSGSIEVYYQQ